MQGDSMLIDHRCCLRAAVTIRAVEIEGSDAMVAESAFEYGAAVDRCGYVMSHTVTVPLPPVLFWDRRCATLEQAALTRQPEGRLTIAHAAEKEQSRFP
jgi:hypothetical protein